MEVFEVILFRFKGDARKCSTKSTFTTWELARQYCVDEANKMTKQYNITLHRTVVEARHKKLDLDNRLVWGINKHKVVK